MSQSETEKSRRFDIDEVSVFAEEGVKHGWIGGGSFNPRDPVSGRPCWVVGNPSKTWSQTLPPHANVTVVVFLRANQGLETLVASFPGGTYESPNIAHTQMNSYWIRGAKADAAGKFNINFRLKSGAALLIHMIEVLAPTSGLDTPESLGMQLGNPAPQ